MSATEKIGGNEKMNKNMMVIGLVLVGALVFFLMNMGGGAITTISVEELQKQLEKGEVTLLDVREIDEYEAGHIDQAINVPLSTLDAETLAYGKDEPVYIICRSGNRSAKAAELLVKAGYTDVYNVDGGMIAWEQLVQ